MSSCARGRWCRTSITHLAIPSCHDVRVHSLDHSIEGSYTGRGEIGREGSVGWGRGERLSGRGQQHNDECCSQRMKVAYVLGTVTTTHPFVHSDRITTRSIVAQILLREWCQQGLLLLQCDVAKHRWNREGLRSIRWPNQTETTRFVGIRCRTVPLCNLLEAQVCTPDETQRDLAWNLGIRHWCEQQELGWRRSIFGRYSKLDRAR